MNEVERQDQHGLAEKVDSCRQSMGQGKEDGKLENIKEIALGEFFQIGKQDCYTEANIAIGGKGQLAE
ncbi:MAG: hypothetical protein NTW95_00185 [Candidatus Aminicenantes bacterium]|nr:hypothetical protein [Candidatus Aminicenantes bacterium]